MTGDPDIGRRLDLLEKLLRELPSQLDERYIDRREYAADQRADDVQLRGLEAEVRSLRVEIGVMEGEMKAERDARETALKTEREARETALRTEAKARQDEKDRRDSEAATLRRLVFTSLAAPVLVAIIAAILLGGVLQ